MRDRGIRGGRIIILALAALLAACAPGVPELPDLWIAPVTDTVDSVPEIPERAPARTVWTQAQALAELRWLKGELEALPGQIDIAVHADRHLLDCEQFHRLYRQMAALPSLASGGDDPLVIWAAEEYNAVVEHLLDTSRDLAHTCGHALLGSAKDEPIPRQRWALARDGAFDGLDRLDTAIRRLETEAFDRDCETQETLLEAMVCTRRYMQRFAGAIHNDERTVYCTPVSENYQRVIEAPTFDVSGADPVTQRAYDNYRQAVQHFTERAEALTGKCRAWFDDPEGEGGYTVHFQQWGVGLDAAEDSIELLEPAIEWMEDR